MKYGVNEYGKPVKINSVYATRFIFEQQYNGKMLGLFFFDADLKTPMKNYHGWYGMRYSYHKVTHELENVYYLTTKNQLNDNSFSFSDTILYNQHNREYGHLRFSVNPFAMVRIKNYVKVTSVLPNSLAAKAGVLPGDIVIKGPGFDERQDCKLSYNEKISLLTSGVADNNKIFLTARIGSNGKIIINRYSNVQESFGIKYEKISLPDNVLYNEIKLNNISEQKGILKHNL